VSLGLLRALEERGLRHIGELRGSR
jgi:hypothetical protein